MTAAMPMATTSAAPVDRTSPASEQQTPASTHFRSSSPTSDHTANAQNIASEYAIDSTTDIGAAANRATRINPVRREPPVIVLPRRARPYEQTTPETIVTVSAEVTKPIPPEPSIAANQRTSVG